MTQDAAGALAAFEQFIDRIRLVLLYRCLYFTCVESEDFGKHLRLAGPQLDSADEPLASGSRTRSRARAGFSAGQKVAAPR
jgi:hypothetical protein